MLKSAKALFIALFILLFANVKNASAFEVVQTSFVSQENNTTKAVSIVADFLSVFEEGILEPATGFIHSSSNTVRTITVAKANLSSALQNKISRHTAFQYLNAPLAEVKPSTGLHLFLRVLLI
jgi:hypothetical protein